MDLIKRGLFEDIKEHLEKKEISLIVGPRQVGKTTLMLLLKEYLEARGAKTAFFNLDSEMDKRFFVSQNDLIVKLRLELGNNKGYVFIDEIQRKEDAGIFLKGIYDLNLPYKLIVSGSGSMELKEKIHESLTGRKRVFELMPVSFFEFAKYKTDYRYDNSLSNFFEIEREKTAYLLDEYLNFGGYPRVILEERLSEKIKTMDEIFKSYIEKDISYLLRVERIDAFSSIIRIISGQVGGLINYSELATTLGISVPTVKNYLWYAERTFILHIVTPHFRNIKKEITRSPVAYFYDIGLRNYARGVFGNLTQPYDFGFLFQNLVFHILKEKFRYSGATIHFWRTKDKAEVDFVVTFGADAIPVEVKYKRSGRIQISRSIHSFIDRYMPKEAWIVNPDKREEFELDKTKIKFIPFYDLITP